MRPPCAGRRRKKHSPSKVLGQARKEYAAARGEIEDKGETAVGVLRDCLAARLDRAALVLLLPDLVRP